MLVYLPAILPRSSEHHRGAEITRIPDKLLELPMAQEVSIILSNNFQAETVRSKATFAAYDHETPESPC
jgi:hypothetical protein